MIFAQGFFIIKFQSFWYLTLDSVVIDYRDFWINQSKIDQKKGPKTERKPIPKLLLITFSKKKKLRFVFGANHFSSSTKIHIADIQVLA